MSQPPALARGGVSVGVVLQAALLRLGVKEPNDGELDLEHAGRMWSGQEALTVFVSAHQKGACRVRASPLLCWAILSGRVRSISIC